MLGKGKLMGNWITISKVVRVGTYVTGGLSWSSRLSTWTLYPGGLGAGVERCQGSWDLDKWSWVAGLPASSEQPSRVVRLKCPRLGMTLLE